MGRRRSGLRRALLPLLVLLLPLGCGGESADPPPEGHPGEAAKSAEEESVPLSPANLYFPDDSGNLSPEGAQVAAEPAELRVRRLAEALIAGPQDPTGVLHAPLPKTTRVAGVLIFDGIAYLDLHGENEGPPPAVGSMDEQMILYSLVDTVVLNTPGVERVVLLWNGSQRETFAGHFDTTRPLAADESLIASR